MITPQRQVRLDDATWAYLQHRGRELGPVVPLTPSDVIRWLIERDRQQQASNGKAKSKGK